MPHFDAAEHEGEDDAAPPPLDAAGVVAGMVDDATLQRIHDANRRILQTAAVLSDNKLRDTFRPPHVATKVTAAIGPSPNVRAAVAAEATVAATEATAAALEKLVEATESTKDANKKFLFWARAAAALSRVGIVVAIAIAVLS